METGRETEGGDGAGAWACGVWRFSAEAPAATGQPQPWSEGPDRSQAWGTSMHSCWHTCPGLVRRSRTGRHWGTSVLHEPSGHLVFSPLEVIALGSRARVGAGTLASSVPTPSHGWSGAAGHGALGPWGCPSPGLWSSWTRALLPVLRVVWGYFQGCRLPGGCWPAPCKRGGQEDLLPWGPAVFAAA